MKILAIETSCDETAAAVVEDGVKILSNVIASSTAMHRKYGGIVPEVAARKQVESMIPVLTEAMTGVKPEEINVIAVTVGPGLIGSLLIGVETAKTLAFVWNKPIIPVNHVLAHMYANFVTGDNQQVVSNQIVIPSEAEGSLANASSNNGFGKLTTGLRDSSTPPADHLFQEKAGFAQNDKSIQFPAISLVVSGGHTELYLMESAKKLKWLGGTLDDAAGEAFDKTARILGFENRGGPAVAAAAAKFHPASWRIKFQIKLPRPMIHDETLNFSFSGLKTAILREVNKLKETKQLNNKTIGLLAYEVQEAITDVLVIKTLKAAEKYHVKSILLSGGVAANLRLREKLQSTINNQQLAISMFVPPVSICTDNAVYIGSYAYFRGEAIQWQKINAEPDLSVEVTK